MSAERLRTAASLLRSRAEAASPGVGPNGAWVVGNVRMCSSPKSVPLVLHPNVTAGGYLGSEANAAYIATMSPPVALALADWLDTQVDRAESIASWRQAGMRYGQEDEEKAALTVADAILGGVS